MESLSQMLYSQRDTHGRLCFLIKFKDRQIVGKHSVILLSSSLQVWYRNLGLMSSYPLCCSSFLCLAVLFRRSGVGIVDKWYMATVHFPFSSLRVGTLCSWEATAHSWAVVAEEPLKMLGHRWTQLHRLLLAKVLKEGSMWTQTFLISWSCTFFSLVLSSQRGWGILGQCSPAD